MNLSRIVYIIAGLTALIFSWSCSFGDQARYNPVYIGPSFADPVEKVMPSVVYIYVEKERAVNRPLGVSAGSGVIMQADGYILTNKHVIEGAQNIEVTLQNRKVYAVADIWRDDILDLAVIKINARNLPTAAFGVPDEIRVGDWVIALGHPLGLSPDEGGATVTAGIVSNLGRSFVVDGIPYYDIIQIDAAINPGNSGGPLINIEGEVIGINSLGVGEAQNISYAINISTAQRVYEDITKYGRVIRPYFGAIMTDVTPALACEYCINRRIGALIIAVEEGAPAEIAGLEPYDVIVNFDETDVISVTQFLKAVWNQDVGATRKIVFWRGSQLMTTYVTLNEKVSSINVPQ